MPGLLLTAVVFLMLAAPCLATAPSPTMNPPIAAAVADFDYFDTSGEVIDQSEAHAKRMRTFVEILKQRLVAQAGLQIVEITCGRPVCSAGNGANAGLIDAARQADARLLIYGGIHKMSTLVQWGRVQVLDLDAERLLLDRSFSFRGDNDKAFERAAGFLVKTLQGVLSSTPLSDGPAEAR